MLSNNYIHSFKNNISEYFNDQDDSNLFLPRFKLIKEFSKDVKNIQSFVPFIRERDQMNRLVRINSEKQRYHTDHSRSPTNQHHTPDGHWHFNKHYILPEKRKKPYLKFNYQIKIEPKIEQCSQRIDSKPDLLEETIKPMKVKQKIQFFQRNNLKAKTKKLMNLNNQNQLTDEPKKFQIQVPTDVLQPYINHEMEQMKQDLFFKVDMDYHFPSDLTDKLIQQKQHIEKLKKRLKEWGEMKSPEDIQDLKEYAKFILQKNT
ncbi:unnamed protein product [Paramecium primaurelia]|uniref:Uncharacterized protein n=1 Tax=Paramecium primaurelia TaxID=5886 RepID=A0A8S1N0X9_PARPR|nr:unnamed protein product [Paramecium primaurelia]